MPDSVARLNFVNGAGPVFKQAIRLRSNAVEVLRRITERIIVNLNFKAGDHWFPRGVGRIERRFVRCALLQRGRGKIEGWAREAYEHATIVFCDVEDPEL